MTDGADGGMVGDGSVLGSRYMANGADCNRDIKGI